MLLARESLSATLPALLSATHIISCRQPHPHSCLLLQRLEQQLAAAQAAAESAGQQVSAATELAETRQREKAAADKEWARWV
jgi:hypothetical protein